MSGPCWPGRCTLLFWLLIGWVPESGAAERICPCVVLEEESDWSLLGGGHCCVNVSMAVSTLDWAVVTRLSGLRVLDLSGTGMVRIADQEGGKNQTNVQFLYLDHNELEDLPAGFLSNAPDLTVVHLEHNKLQRLPGGFLRLSDQIQEIYLNFNNLKSLPVSLLKPSLTRLNFLNNSVECSCSFHDQLEPALRNNSTRPLLGDVVCASPAELSGLPVSELGRGRVCRSHSLTIALICVPLAVLFLLGCWYMCCHAQRAKYPSATRECSLVTVDRNGAGQLHHYEPRQGFQTDRKELGPGQFRDPILLKPSAALLGSSRDLYEEVDIKAGTSKDSLVKGELCQEGAGLALASEDEDDLKADQVEAETASVTEVMKDSADREKLYLGQSADYYSLVPGLDLGDSDHGDYESVDLS